jgi:hypothetical protein
MVHHPCRRTQEANSALAQKIYPSHFTRLQIFMARFHLSSTQKAYDQTHFCVGLKILPHILRNGLLILLCLGPLSCLTPRIPGVTPLQWMAISSEHAFVSLGRRRTSRLWMMASLSSSMRQASSSSERCERRHSSTRPSPIDHLTLKTLGSTCCTSHKEYN